MIYAEIDPQTGDVIQMIVADKSFIYSGAVGDPDRWVLCSRKNIRSGAMYYPGIGDRYNCQKDTYQPPRPTDPDSSRLWTWNDRCVAWVPSKPLPPDPWAKTVNPQE